MVAVWLNVPLLCQAGRALRAGPHAHSGLCPFPFNPLRSCPGSPGQHGVSLKKTDNNTQIVFLLTLVLNALRKESYSTTTWQSC